MFSSCVIASLLLSTAAAHQKVAGTVLWDGRFSNTTLTTVSAWSWASQTGPYQYYIHGAQPMAHYLSTSKTYKNPADNSSELGLKLTIDSTSTWDSDLWRTELIPQTTAAINKGKVYYHFSMKHSSVNPPSANYEHQVTFFESHFTEMKFGWINGEVTSTPDPNLRWEVNTQSKWNVTFTADIWHNIAYGIDFTGGSVSFYHSTGGDPLKLTAGPIAASGASSNGEDWHLGVLRLPRTGYNDTAAEDWYFSNVYIESGTLTTSVSGPSGASPAIKKA